jgi:quercetin dioxygenase-like cupin family protein
MKMEEVDSNEQYKVLSVTLNAGEAIPLHHATSEALLIGRKGKGRITFADRQLVVSQGDSILIKANEPHQMNILEDFSGYLVLDFDARINFGAPEV